MVKNKQDTEMPMTPMSKDMTRAMRMNKKMKLSTNKPMKKGK